jgi:hypothetical protein
VVGLRIRGDEHAAHAAEDQQNPAPVSGGPQGEPGHDVAGADTENGQRDHPAVGHAD